MLKKLLTVLFSLLISIMFTSVSFGQEEPVNTDNVKGTTTDKPADTGAQDTAKPADATTEKTGEGAATIPVQPAQAEGKVFYKDGEFFVNAKTKFKLQSKDNIALNEMKYKVDNGEFKKYEGSFLIPDEGKHIITYYGTDLVDNTELEKTFKVIVDANGPDMVVSTNKAVVKVGDKYYISKNHSFSMTATDKLAGLKKVEYSINGQEYKECAVPFTITVDASAQLKFKATDNVNNVNETFVLKVTDEAGKETELKDLQVAFAIDNTTPVIEVKADKELKVVEGVNIAPTEVKYSVSADDKESGISEILVRVDGKGDFNPYKKPLEFKNNGEHMIEAQAFDRAGNASNVLIYKVVVDTIAPDTTIKAVDDAADTEK